MTSFTPKSDQRKLVLSLTYKEDKKDECSQRSRKDGRSCSLAKEKISGSTFLNTAIMEAE